MEQKTRKPDSGLWVFIGVCVLICVVAFYGRMLYDMFYPSERLNAYTEPAAEEKEEPQAAAEQAGSFESAVYLYESVLKTGFNGNCSAVFDGTENLAHYQVWSDDVNAYALDAATQNIKELEIWQQIESSTCRICDKSKEWFADIGHANVDVVIDIIDSIDYKTKLATIENGVLTYDIVDATPAGEVISRNVYGETRSLSPTSDALTNYVLNTATKVFHRPGCSDINRMSKGNMVSGLYERDTVIAMGYRPCEHCDP